MRRALVQGGTLLLVLVALLPGAAADVLVPKSGKKLRGAIVKETDSEVVFNIYFSRNPAVTNPEHLIRLPKSKVKSVERKPHPRPEVFRRIQAAKEGDIKALVEAGDYAKKHKLKGHAKMCYALALAQDDNDKAALKGIGGRPKWEAARKGNPMLDHELQGMLDRYVTEEDAAERTKMLKAIKGRGMKIKPHELERYRRSVHQPKGYQRDRPLAWRSDQHPGAVYTLFVPKEYTPSKPWPLIIGLHGGGAGGKAGDEVVGSGPSAMNFYRDLAGKRKFLVACPTALIARWGNPVNEELVRDVITELRLLYHIDIDRIYLTGHSMGGFGTWALGPRLAEDLAAVSPMAGGGSGVPKLVATKTPVFIFHGADDKVVGPSSDRANAKQLLGSGHDWVYTELDKVGHGFPRSVQIELFDFFEPRRRYDKKYKDTWPRSSFLGKVSKEETRYLGDPMAAIRGDTPDLKHWLSQLKLGGGCAVAAIAKLVEQKPEGAVAGIAKVLGNVGNPFDARAYAARALGQLGAAAAAKTLRKAVALEATREQSMVARESAKALVALKDADGLSALGKGIEAWTVYYESKVSGKEMRYSDWNRSTTVLADLVAAWASLAPADAKPAVLEKVLVQRVLQPQHKVQTSSRVPQDPSATRAAMARAIAQAYQRTNAPAESWTRLLNAVAPDPKAHAAVAALKP